MEQVLSFPDTGDASIVSEECTRWVAANVLQMLRQVPRHSLWLLGIEASMPIALRQIIKTNGGLRAWLSRYPHFFILSDTPGNASVTLIPGKEIYVADALHAVVPSPELMSTPRPTPSDEANASADPQFDEEGDGQSASHLRGSPYRITREGVHDFFGPHVVAGDTPIRRVITREMLPTFLGHLSFVSPEYAKACRDEFHLRFMENRCVEVLFYSECPSRGRQNRGGEDASVPDGGRVAATTSIPPAFTNDAAAGVTANQGRLNGENGTNQHARDATHEAAGVIHSMASSNQMASPQQAQMIAPPPMMVSSNQMASSQQAQMIAPPPMMVAPPVTVPQGGKPGGPGPGINEKEDLFQFGLELEASGAAGA